MKSPTDAFEDAEMAREELLRPDVLTDLREILYRLYDVHMLPAAKQIGFASDYISRRIAEIEGRGLVPNSVAADAWDEGVFWALTACGYDKEWIDLSDFPGEEPTRAEANPYRVAAPEGDGGNE